MKSRRMSSELALYESMPTRASRQADVRSLGLPASILGEGESAEQGTSLWTVLDDRMRGRWRWACILGLGLATALGAIGYFTATPMYRSVGAVRITPQVPAVLRQTELHEQRYYEQFRTTQIRLIKNDRVLERALTDEELSKMPWTRTPGVVRQMKENLTVESDRDSLLIFVWYESPDPTVAQAVTNAVLKAYFEIYGQYNGQDVPGTLAELKDNEARYLRDLNMLQTDRRTIEAKYQTSDLVGLQKSNMDMLATLESQIRAG